MHCSVIKVPYVICVTAYDLAFRRPFSGRALLSYQTLFPLSTAFWEKFRAFFRVFFTPDSHLCTRFRAPTRYGVSGQDRPGIPGPSTQEAKERIEVIEHARHGIARDIGQRGRAEFGIYHQCKEEIQQPADQQTYDCAEDSAEKAVDPADDRNLLDHRAQCQQDVQDDLRQDKHQQSRDDLHQKILDERRDVVGEAVDAQTDILTRSGQ